MAELASYYCMAKAALDMYTKCAALALTPKGVRVNSVKSVDILCLAVIGGKLADEMFQSRHGQDQHSAGDAAY